MKSNNFLCSLLVILTVAYIVTTTSCKKRDHSTKLEKSQVSASVSNGGSTNSLNEPTEIDNPVEPGEEAEGIRIDIPCERTILPPHEKLWQALAAMQIKYSKESYINTGEGHHNYIGIWQDLHEELNRRLESDQEAPQPNDVLPFICPDTKTRLVFSNNVHLLNSSHIVSGARGVYSKTRDAIKLVGGWHASAINTVAKFVITENPVGLATQLGVIPYYVYRAGMTRYNYSFVKDLIPGSEESEDPDRCTCTDHICDRLADLYVFRQPQLVVKSGIRVLPVVGKYCYAIANTLSRFEERMTNPNPAAFQEGQRFLERFKTRQAWANYLWEAAQTQVRLQDLDASKIKRENWSEWGLPSSSYSSNVVIVKKGCPKAIALVAAILGDYFTDKESGKCVSNYVRTLATITAQDGKTIIHDNIYWR